MKKHNIKYKTDFILPKNNFWVGLGSVFNLAGNYYDNKSSKSGEIADKKALKSDWDNIGNDFDASCKLFKSENKQKLCL